MAANKDYKTPDKNTVADANSTQDTIELRAVAADGIFEYESGKYSKTYAFSDVNYDMKSEEEKVEFIMKYVKVLNKMSVPYKLTFINRAQDKNQFEEQVFIPLYQDEFDVLRKDRNNIIAEKAKEGRQGIQQDMYITQMVERENYESAKNYFISLESQLTSAFASIGSVVEAQNCEQRLKILYDFYRYGDDMPFQFDFDSMVENCRDFKNDIAPYLMEVKPDYVRFQHQYVRALYIKDLPSQLTNDILKLMTDTSMRMIITVDAHPVPKKYIADLFQKTYLNVENKIRKQQKNRNRNNDFSSDISYKVQEEKRDIVSMMDDAKNNDTNYSYASVSILLQADTLEELNQNTESVKMITEGESVYVDTMYYRQREGINTVLPIGKCQWYTSRLLSAGSLTAFFPFRSKELLMDKGVVYGINQISKNLSVGDRRRLMNGNGWIFGGSGSGKSTAAKDEITQNIMRLNDKCEVVILDPNNEYAPICDMFHGAYIDVRPGSSTRINGFDQPDNRSVDEYASAKFGWTLGMLELLMKRSLTASESAMVERAILELYAPYMNGAVSIKEQQPDMAEFQAILAKYTDTEELVIALERLITGSFNMFGQKSTVNTNARVTVYGFQNVSKDMFGLANFIIMESLQQKCYQNYQKGIATYIYIDEAHEFLGFEQAADYMQKLWRELRKVYGFCTGITHEVADVCKNKISRSMISSSEFVLLLKQTNVDTVRDVYQLTPAETSYITDPEPGCGLLKFGKTIVAIDNRIPKGTMTYDLINTDPDKHVK